MILDKLTEIIKSDPKLGQDILRAMEDPVFFCRRFLTNPDNGGPFNPNYIQRQYMKDDAQIKYIWVHRRGGKSFGIIALMLWYAVFQKKQIYYFAQSSKIVDEIFGKLDGIIEASPFIQLFIDKDKSNTRNPQVRTFSSGATCNGWCVTNNTAQVDTLRGLTPDITFIDEAQNITEEGFRMLNPFYIAPDASRMHSVKAYICGTVKNPEGEFYKRTVLKDLTPRMSLLKVSIKENPDITDEMRDEFFAAEKGNMDRWNTEYALIIRASATDAAFPREYIERAFDTEYYYGKPEVSEEMEEQHYIRYSYIVTADWDKKQAGSNIVVWQYDKISKLVKLIDRWEAPREETFSYHMACEKLIEFFLLYKCDHIVVDSGNGDVNIEIIHKEAQAYGIQDEIEEKLIRLPFQSTILTYDPTRDELVKQQAKQFLYKLTLLKLERGEVKVNSDDLACYQQFLDYKIIGIGDKGRLVFSKLNEHIIDCLMFGMFAVWSFFNDILTDYKVVDEFPDFTPTSVTSEITTALVDQKDSRNVQVLGRNSVYLRDNSNESLSAFSLSADAPSWASREML